MAKNLLLAVLGLLVFIKIPTILREKWEQYQLKKEVESLNSASQDFVSAMKLKKPMFILPNLRLCHTCQNQLKVLGKVFPEFKDRYSIVYLVGEESAEIPDPNVDALGALLFSCEKPHCLYNPSTGAHRGVLPEEFEEEKLAVAMRKFGR